MNLVDNISFVILCPELNPGGLRSSVSAIRGEFPGATYCCVVPEESQDVQDLEKYAKVVKGKGTITSLMNAGFHACQRKWAYLLFAGCLVRYSFLKKYQRFYQDEKDIFYTIADKRSWRFEEASLNGMLVPVEGFKEIGDMPEQLGNLQICKLCWALDAIDKKYRFKGLVGVKLI